MTAMGQFRVTGRLTGATGRIETVDLLVDTGATLLVVPQPLAFALDLVTLRTQPVVLAGGSEEVWAVSEVRVAIEGRETITPCFIAPGGPPLLGAVALESLFLAVDPVAKRLVPVRGYAATSEPILHTDVRPVTFRAVLEEPGVDVAGGEPRCLRPLTRLHPPVLVAELHR